MSTKQEMIKGIKNKPIAKFPKHRNDMLSNGTTKIGYVEKIKANLVRGKNCAEGFLKDSFNTFFFSCSALKHKYKTFKIFVAEHLLEAGKFKILETLD